MAYVLYSEYKGGGGGGRRFGGTHSLLPWNFPWKWRWAEGGGDRRYCCSLGCIRRAACFMGVSDFRVLVAVRTGQNSFLGKGKRAATTSQPTAKKGSFP